MAVFIAVLLAVFAMVATKAGMKGFAKFLGLLAILAFVWWLSSGPGFAFLDWLDNPRVDVPDNIPVPGQWINR